MYATGIVKIFQPTNAQEGKISVVNSISFSMSFTIPMDKDFRLSNLPRVELKAR